MADKVLVVEDDKDLRSFLELAIEDLFAVEVITAANGTTALRLAREQRPAAILLDIMLPDIDGLRVARELKGDPSTSGIPILAVTASAHRDDALAAGCDDYIGKPFALDTLLAKMQPFLQ